MDGKKNPNFLKLWTNQRWQWKQEQRRKRSRRIVIAIVSCGVFGVLAVPIIFWVVGLP